jgi:hypothetical protein
VEELRKPTIPGVPTDPEIDLASTKLYDVGYQEKKTKILILLPKPL